MIIALSGPSGIGKGYIKENLMRLHPDIRELAWFTTRVLRPGESERSNRIHVSSAEFQRLAQSGKLAMTQDIFGHRYGLDRGELSTSSEVRITEIHPANLAEAVAINPAILAIGLVTFESSLLWNRLAVIRKTESPAEIDSRVAQAEDEVQLILQQKSLFATIVEVSAANEHLVLEKVFEALTPHLRKGD